MNKLSLLTTLGVLFASCISSTAFGADKPTPAEVKALTTKVADWQIETFDQHGKHRALPSKKTGWQNQKNYHDLTWHMAALYVGYDEFRKVAEQPEKYSDFLKMVAERNDWKLHRLPYHADFQAVGQVWLSLYEDFKDPKMLQPTRERFDWILANPKTGSLEYSGYGKKNTTAWLDRWGWCDALFMAPPVWARLAKITGEEKYLDFMDQEYHLTYDVLWDKEEHFFYRDTRFFDQREDNGAKIFWSRGNGWVFGGLALMIPDLPKNWEGREFYLDLYQEMAEALRKTQRPDGTWSMGLLGSLESYPSKETTGTSFFTFGLAWGINNGLLDRATYEPLVFNAWQALEACVTPAGMLGFVQPVGAAPGETIADKTEVYAIGAFLAAGAEMYKLVGGSEQTANVSSTRTYARFVPERKDDFAWENDKIAFRTYGPALRDSTENSGIDAWLKRVDYPIIDKWYKQAEAGKSYHKDHGEGLDNYHVGSSAGVGGAGIWLDGQREPLETFTDYEVLEVSPARSRFKLSYQREIDGATYSEEKTITIELGQRLFQVDSIFFKNGQAAANLPVCIGLTTHDGKAASFFDRAAGWIATWESLGDSELGTGAKMDPQRLESIQVVDSKKKDTSHIFLITRTDANGRLSYAAGYGWKKAGEITTRDTWRRYLGR
jgi:rhamnogalacturonyl hydrolase YesR